MDQDNLTIQQNPTHQRIGVPGVGEVVRLAAEAAWLATKAFPKAEKRLGINDPHVESVKVHDEIRKVPVEIQKEADWNRKVLVKNFIWRATILREKNK